MVWTLPRTVHDPRPAMVKAVFDARPGSGYDDDIAHRYHFPDRYLTIARQAVGDWVAYREPTRGHGRAGYVATARLVAIDPDTEKSRHSYARMVDYLPFDAVVPLRRPIGGFFEKILDAVPSDARLGAALQGRSLRLISDPEFGAIARAGLGETLAPANAVRLELDPANTDPLALSLAQAPPEEQERRIVQILTNRKIRDAAFRRAVCDAYDDTCAVTGLRIVNGGGKAEAQAAHIQPVADGGPDVVQNGIALSATVHWLFDRHLISLTDELALLVSHNKVPTELRGLFDGQMQRIRLPKDEGLWPHPHYVRRHREAFATAGP
jgi:putative restriction endonuclease